MLRTPIKKGKFGEDHNRDSNFSGGYLSGGVLKNDLPCRHSKRIMDNRPEHSRAKEVDMKTGAALLVFLFLFPCGCLAGDELIQEQKGHRVTPEIIEPTDALLKNVKLPDNFTIEIFAAGLGAPRMMTSGSDGTVFITRPDSGDVLALADKDNDGRVDETRTAVSGLPDVHGIAVHQDRMYLATVQEVYAASMQNGMPGKPGRILAGLPPGGRHPNRTLGVGPDGKLYITVGSTCNCCIEDYPESAAILTTGLEGNGKEIFATGLRNTVGFGWHPRTGQLFGMDHGTDWLGDDFPPEELNRLEKGKFYGWPLASAGSVIRISEYPKEFNPKAYLAKTNPPVLTWTPHSAPLQMVFYTGSQFPGEYVNNAFVAMHGSWNRKPPSGYEVIRIVFNENGKPERIAPFATGFLMTEENRAFARPTGLAVAKDGSLLIGSDKTGVIFRVSYKSKQEGKRSQE